MIAVEGRSGQRRAIWRQRRARGASECIVPGRRSSGLRRAAVGRCVPDVVVLDPPRTGMSPDALAATHWRCARRVSSMSRAIRRRWRAMPRRLVTAGYASTSVDGFDLFPEHAARGNRRGVRRVTADLRVSGTASGPAGAPRRAHETIEQRRELSGPPDSSPDAIARRRRSDASGCSIASTTPSGAVAETTNPGATALDGLMMAAVDGQRPPASSRRAAARPGSVSGAMRDVVRDRVVSDRARVAPPRSAAASGGPERACRRRRRSAPGCRGRSRRAAGRARAPARASAIS